MNSATGQNRFRAPQPPEENRGEVQTGSQGRICPQASPAWGAISAQFIPRYLAGQTEFNESSFNLSSSGETPAVDPRTNEDCLFMDVVVPQAIFDSAGHGGQGAAVLVWIYGGGYTAGSKSGSGNPAGLIKRSQSEASEGVIVSSFLTLNSCSLADLHNSTSASTTASAPSAGSRARPSRRTAPPTPGCTTSASPSSGSNAISTFSAAIPTASRSSASPLAAAA